MSLKLNILIVSSYWAGEKSTGGVAQMASVLARELTKHHNVAVLINKWEAPAPRHGREHGVNVISYRLRSPLNAQRPVRNFFRWVLQFARELRDIRKIIRDHRTDIVQIRYPEPEFFIFRVLRFFGGPRYCISFHGSDVARYSERNWCSRVLLEWLIAGASASSAVSRSLAAEAEKTFVRGGKVRTIYNGKSIEGITAAHNGAQISPSPAYPEPYFVNPANVAWEKGQDVLIRAWAKLPGDLRHFHLVIAGEARDAWEPCRRLIEEIGCSDRVHLAGPLPQSELFAVMRGARGCIMPSRREGFCGSVLEAGALGLGLICTDVPSFREIVRHGVNGLIVSSEDPDSLADAIADLARNPALARRLGEALRTIVRAQFSVEQMTDGYLEQYRDVLSSARQPTVDGAPANYQRGHPQT